MTDDGWTGRPPRLRAALHLPGGVSRAWSGRHRSDTESATSLTAGETADRNATSRPNATARSGRPPLRVRRPLPSRARHTAWPRPRPAPRFAPALQSRRNLSRSNVGLRRLHTRPCKHHAHRNCHAAAVARNFPPPRRENRHPCSLCSPLRGRNTAGFAGSPRPLSRWPLLPRGVGRPIITPLA